MRTMTPDKGQKGYTLIEMAIVISVIGLILASFISAYDLYKKTQARQVTENNLSLVTAALGNFLIQKGRYPCPAHLNLDRTADLYGIETECDPLVTTATAPREAYPSPTPAAGTCANGLCYEAATGVVVDADPAASNVCPLGCVTPKVRRGSVPFRTLGIPEEQSIDGWGNRLQYAVTENLAVTTTFVRKSGGIRIYDTNEGSTTQLTPNDNLAHYFLFSSGADRAGAWSTEGKAVRPCGTTGYDSENCNTGVTHPRSNYSAANYALATGATHFDDIVNYFASVETPLWKISADNSGFHIRDLISAETTGHVGIGTTLADNGVRLDVAGETRANNGRLYASRICDAGGANCLNTSDFAQGTAEFQCPPGQYARAFGAKGADNKYIKCIAASDAMCPPGEVMKSVDFSTDPRGQLVCSKIVQCPAKTFTLCAGTPAQTTYTATVGQQYNPPGTPEKVSPVVGSNYQERYRCLSDGSGTFYRKTSSTGYCVCNAVDEYNDQDCSSYKGTGANTWGGVVTRHHVHTCPANTDSTTISGNTCVCTPTSETRLASCAAGLTGNITQQRNWICDTPTAGHWTGWSNVSNTCTCTPSTQYDSQSCAAHETGSITRHRDISCPGPTTGSWVVDTNTCTCNADVENYNESCPAGQSGAIQKTHTWNCATGTWGPSSILSNSCACAGTVETRNSTPCPGAYDTGTITEQRNQNCDGTWGSWVPVSNTCSCVAPDPQTRPVACPSPLLGSKTEASDYSCATGTWGPWYLLQDNCGTVAYFWTAKSAATGPFGSPLSTQQGGSCTTPGTKVSCSSPAGGGQYWHYNNCECE